MSMAGNVRDRSGGKRENKSGNEGAQKERERERERGEE